ncbi:glycosyltransferase family 9 protein [Chlorobium sp. N1]|uniref:glycosyltransferase family 9 protein n=1 Tax=Chlorobium sp. N1 TaxID=2491138 RepID=UPI00103DFFB9|nr:glycosyltransferase family 9 protein [Chlorobium sp. N1]TCD48925.1 glycosyltransferase family 9 protein [Chlorobium sp. N1]
MVKHSPENILVVVQRSNGDVFLSEPLLRGLARAYGNPRIDLLVNDDTLAIAKTLPHVSGIHTYSYRERAEGKKGQSMALYRKLFLKYDLAISLTASDRSVLFARVAARKAISAVEPDPGKSRWKRLLLSGHYRFDTGRHILENNTAALGLLGIDGGPLEVRAHHTAAAGKSVERMLAERGIGEFILFHPGAQYEYKVYPQEHRNKLLAMLDGLGVAIVVTGSKSAVDIGIKRSLPKLRNLHDFIGCTSMDELIALSARSMAYIGADTLNMHIAAAQDRQVFAIFGPTLPATWSPWCNGLHRATRESMPVQRYGNITMFQADMECVPCGKAGCDDHHGRSDCLYHIEPETIFHEVEAWLKRSR